MHTVNFGSEMVEALQVSRKNIFCSLNVDKIKEKRIFEIVHCPFELSPNQHRPAGPFGWLYWCSSAQSSKGQCTISKILSSPILSLFIEQTIFLPETYNAYTISVPKFTVWRDDNAAARMTNFNTQTISSILRDQHYVRLDKRRPKDPFSFQNPLQQQQHFSQ